MTDVTLKINGETRSASVPPETTLLKMLRENFNLTGAKPVSVDASMRNCTAWCRTGGSR